MAASTPSLLDPAFDQICRDTQYRQRLSACASRSLLIQATGQSLRLITAPPGSMGNPVIPPTQSDSPGEMVQLPVEPPASNCHAHPPSFLYPPIRHTALQCHWHSHRIEPVSPCRAGKQDARIKSAAFSGVFVIYRAGWGEILNKDDKKVEVRFTNKTNLAWGSIGTSLEPSPKRRVLDSDQES